MKATNVQMRKGEILFFGREVPRKRGYKPHAYFDKHGDTQFRQVKIKKPEGARQP